MTDGEREWKRKVEEETEGSYKGRKIGGDKWRGVRRAEIQGGDKEERRERDVRGEG